MMWIQTVFPESPFYNLKLCFSHRSMVRVRNAAVSLWSFGGAFGEKIQSQGALRLFDLSFLLHYVDTNHHTGIHE